MSRPTPQVDGVKRLPNGRYRLRIWVDGGLVKRTFDRREDAEDVRDELRRRATISSLGITPSAPAAVPTVGSVLDAYHRECEVLDRSAAHLRSISLARAYLTSWAGEHRPANLTRGDLVGFVAWMRANTASRGRVIHNALVILRTALRLADLPVPAAPRLELPVRAPKTMPKEDLLALLAVLPLGSLARTALDLGLWTGARSAEVFRIRRCDVDLERGTVLLRRAKGKPGRRGSEEVLPVPPALRASLEAFLAKRDAFPGDAPLLSLDGKRPITHSTLRKTIVKACLAAGIPQKTSIGWTRAQVTTLLRESRASLRDAARFAGHQDAAVTRTHYDESQREAEERWNARVLLQGTLEKALGVGYDRGTTKGRKAPRRTPRETAKSSGINTGP